MIQCPDFYLAGPMTGYHLYNFPAFEAATSALRTKGFTVFSPAEYCLQQGFDPAKDAPAPFHEYMAVDLPMVCRSKRIALLRGWGSSKGANLELHTARECGKPAALWADTLQPMSILEEAQELVHGARGKSYGSPFLDYQRTVSAFNALRGKDLTAEDGAVFMVCVKLSREHNRSKRDNRVDAAGYIECLDMMVAEREAQKLGA